MIEFLITIISFTVVVGILIFVHEFGHFIVAKATGVEVEKFSLGFGPKLIGFRRGETQYMISAIPLGGYVKLKGENPDETLTNDPKEFGSRSVGVRFAIVGAGPFMNFLLAFVLMPLVYIIGIQVNAFLEREPVVGWVADNSSAMMAGIQVGDHILTVNGEEVKNWEDFYALNQTKLGEYVKIEIARNNSIKEKMITPHPDDLNIAGMGLFHKMDAQVGGIFNDSPAEEAGLKPGDLIKEIGDTKITHWIQMSEVIKKHPGEEVTFKIERESKTLTCKIKPVAVINKIEAKSAADLAGLKVEDTILTINDKDVSYWKKVLLNKKFTKGDKFNIVVSRDGEQLTTTVISQETQDIGIRIVGKVGIIQYEDTVLKKFGILASLREGFKKNIELTGKVFWALKKLFTFKLSIKTLGGPIIIAKMTGTAAKSGLSYLLIFTAFLSLNLSIINLFPIPILDGGHMLFLLIELIMRKPLEAKKMEIAQRIGIVLLILLFLTITYNDIMRSVPEKYLDFLPWK
jgi:regulator of sigma E protease